MKTLISSAMAHLDTDTNNRVFMYLLDGTSFDAVSLHYYEPGFVGFAERDDMDAGQYVPVSAIVRVKLSSE